MLRVHFKALLHRCLHRLIVLPMQQAVGCKCGIVILDDLVSVGKEIYMGQKKFRRVDIHCEVQFINGRLLRRTDLRREDVIPDMLGKARSSSQLRYLEMLQQSFQLRKLLFTGRHILLDGSPLCEVTESGGVTYRNEDIDEPERIAAKDKVYEIVRTTAEYMRQMEMAPFLKADGLEDGYKVLADFNGTVLAGVQSKHGVHFVTWDWAYGHTGVCHGHYFMENYAGAKQDFAIRSGLIQKERLFTPEQMTEIYRCCADSVDGDFFELTGEQEKMIRSVQQQIEECVPDLDERIRQQEEALEQVAQQQTM